MRWLRWLPSYSLFLAVLALLGCVLVCARANAQVDNLINAAGMGDLSRVRALLDAKADVNAMAGDGATALIMASHNGHADVVQLLKGAALSSECLRVSQRLNLRRLPKPANKGVARLKIRAQKGVCIRDAGLEQPKAT